MCTGGDPSPAKSLRGAFLRVDIILSVNCSGGHEKRTELIKLTERQLAHIKLIQ